MQQEVTNRLEEARGKKPCKTVAAELGIPYQTMRAYEKGWRRPSDKVKVKLAEYYHTTVQELFFN